MKKYLFAVSLVVILLSCVGCTTMGQLFGVGKLVLPENSDMSDDVLNIWNVESFIDSYGLPTNKKFVQTEINGYFSNSATTGSEFTGYFRITDMGKIEIGILEYGSYRVGTYIDDEYYNIAITNSNDDVILKSTISLGSDRFSIYGNDAQTIINTLATSNDTFSIYISGGKYSKSAYIGVISSLGFAKKASEIAYFADK